jgi:hypothetical protein
MAKRLVTLSALVLLSACARAPAPPPPLPQQPNLFALFQKYCLATGGRYDAVDKAATADGYANLKDKAVLANILHIDSTTWQKKRDIISVGPLHNIRTTPDGKAETIAWDPPDAKAESCHVEIVRQSDDSQAAFAKWAGVPVWHSPRAADVGDEISDFYHFRIENGKHVPETGSIHSADTLRAGTWAATLFKRGTEYSMSLRHYYVPQTASSAVQ